MNDLLSIAARFRAYADEPGTSEQKQKDLLVGADVLAIISALPDASIFLMNGKDSPIPG